MSLLLFFSSLLFPYFTVVSSVLDTQCYHGVNGEHLEDLGTREVPSTESVTLGPQSFQRVA